MDPFTKENLITTKDASEFSGYTSDYLARLVRSGEIIGKKIGHSWLVDKSSLETFLGKQKDYKLNRSRELADSRAREYRSHNQPIRRFTNDLTKRFSVVHKSPSLAPDFQLVETSFRSHATALAAALLVVASGASLANAQVVSHVAGRVASVATEAAESLATTYGDIPSRIASRISDARHAAAGSVARVALMNAEVTASIAPAALAHPDITPLQMVLDGHANGNNRAAHFAQSPALGGRASKSIAAEPAVHVLTRDEVQAFAVGAFRLATSPAQIAQSLTRSYLALGTSGYALINSSLAAYRSLIDRAGGHTLALATVARDTLATAPRTIERMNLALGSAVIGATHAAIRAEVGLAYGTAAAAPAAAHATVAFMGTAGGMLAEAVSRAPSLATAAFLRTTEAPSRVAPALAQAIFNTEYEGANHFLAFTGAVTESYVSGVMTTGAIAYEGARGARAALAAAPSLAARVPALVEDAYLGALGKTALALAPLRSGAAQVLADLQSASLTSAGALAHTAPVAAVLAATAPALSAGEQVALTTYREIHGLFDSMTSALAVFFTPSPLAVAPAPTAPAKKFTTLTPPVQQPVRVAQTVNTYPTYTTLVRGLTQEALDAALMRERTTILATVAGMVQPVAAQGITNMTTIQQVNMIQDLSNLIVRNGDFRGGTFTGGTFKDSIAINANTATFTSLNGTDATFTTLSAGVSRLATTTVTGDLTLAGNQTVSGTLAVVGALSSDKSVTAPYFVASSTSATSTYAGSLAVGTSQFVVDHATGNVGMGVLSPTALLAVRNSTSTQPIFVASSAAGTEVYRITNAGFVGIGSTTPGYALAVEGASSLGNQAIAGYFTATTSTATSTLAGSLAVGTTTPFGNGLFTVGTTSPLLHISSNTGNIGLHTLASAYTLDVNGTLRTVGDASFNSNVSLGDATSTDITYVNSRIAGHLVPTIDNVSDIGDGANWLRWRTGYFGTSVGIAGTATSTGASLLASGAYLIDSASPLSINTTHNQNVHFGTGNVGLGVAVPSYTLDVSGQAHFTSYVDAAHFIATSTSATSTFMGGFAAGNNAAFAVNQAAPANSLYVSTSGNVGIGSTSPATALAVTGSGYFTGGLGIGISTTTPGVLQTSGDARIGGNLTVVGNSTVLGGSMTDSLIINSAIKSNIVPNQNITYDLGSPSYYWRNIYVGNVIANNISAASTTIAGTASATFTINSSNTTADAQDSTLVFFRGLVTPNALLSWNSAASMKRFEFNQPLFIQNASASTTITTFDVKAVAGQTADLFRVASSSGANFLNLSAAGYLGIGSSTPSTNFSVQGNGLFSGNLTAANITATGTVSLLGATTFPLAKGNFLVGNDAGVSQATSSIFISSTGNVGIGTTSPTVKFSVGGAAGDTTGHGYFTGGLGIGIVNTIAGTLQTAGNAAFGGNATVSGTLTVNGLCVVADTRLRRRRKAKKGEEDEADEEGYIYDEVDIIAIQEGDEIQSFDEKTGKLAWSRVKQLAYMGKKQTYEVTTASGKTIRTTANHPYLTRRVEAVSLQKPRVHAFIDASNLYYGAKENKHRIDFRKFASYLRTRYGVSRIFYYTGLNLNSIEQLDFYVQLDRYGYEMRYVAYKVFNPGDDKADVDARMATDLLTSAGSYDQAVVITGDGDFFWTLQHLMLSGKEIKLLGYANRTARELKRLVGSDFRDMVNIFPALDTMKVIKSATDTVKVSVASSTSLLYSVACELSTLLGSSVDREMVHEKKEEMDNLADQILYGVEENENGATKKITPSFRATDAFDEFVAGVKTQYSHKGNLSIRSGDNVSAGEGSWLKVAELREGMEIAVADGDGAAPRSGAAWDRIVSVEPITEEDVYDIEVEGTHNFIGNGIVAHNTAFFNQASTTQLSVTTRAYFGGTATTTIDSAGNLSVAGTLGVTGQSTLGYASTTQIGSTGSAYFATAGGNVGIGTASPAASLHVVYSGNNNPLVEQSTAGNGVGFTLKASGEASGTLVYYPSTYADPNFSGAMTLNSWQAGGKVMLRAVDATGIITLFTGGSASANERMRITATGNVGIGTTTPWARLSADTSSLAAGVPSFVVGSSTRTDLVVTQAGNVGIGTASPSSLLNVYSGAASQFNFISGGASVSQLVLGQSSVTTTGGVLGEDRTGNEQLYLDSRNSASSIAFKIAGSEKVRVDSTGNVGIGTTTPSTNLSIQGNGLFSGNLSAANITATGTVSLLGATTFPLAKGNFLVGSDAGVSQATSTIFISSTGSVGIGTTGPGMKLEVNGNIFANGATSDVVYNGSLTNIANLVGSGGYWGLRTSTNHNLNVDVYNSNSPIIAMTVQQNGNVGIGATTPGAKLEVNGMVYATGATVPTAGVGTAIGGDGTNSLIYGKNATGWAPMYIDATKIYLNAQSGGGVGIGTSAPAASFDVNGTLLARGGAIAAGAYGVTVTGAAGADRDIFLAGAAGLSNGFTVQRVSGAMRYVFNDGNVGIGTTTPSTKLVVNGDVTVGSSGAGATLADFGRLNVGITGDTYPALTIGDNATPASAAGIYLRSNGTSPAGISTAGAPLAFFIGGPGTGEAMRITSAGNIGIGTTTPRSILDVTKATAGDSITWTNNAASNKVGYLYSNASIVSIMAGANGTDTGISLSTTLGTTIYSNDQTKYLAVNNNGIISTGYLGVGTSTPSTNFSVQGNGLFSGNLSAANITATGTVSLLGATTFPLAKGNFLVGSDAGVSQATSTIFISSTGSVGIGSTSPMASLSITGANALSTGRSLIITNSNNANLLAVYNNGQTVHTAGTAATPSLTFATDLTSGIYQDTGAVVRIAVGGSRVASFVSTGLQLYGGTTAASGPSLSIDNGGTTGLFLPAAGTIGFSAAGTETMRITSTGNVGIGTTSPYATLSVSTAAQQAGTLPLFQVASTTNSALFTVLGNGNVGIGTTNPGSLLHVSGTTNDGTSLTTLTQAGTGRALYITRNVASATRATVNFAQLSATAGTDAVLDIQQAATASNAIRVTTDGATANFSVTGTGNVYVAGNVGIGTTTPSTNLSVQGNGLFSGNLSAANITATGTVSLLGATTFPLAKGNFLVGSDAGVSQATSSIFISSTGSVGIGTTGPGQKFVVQGADGAIGVANGQVQIASTDSQAIDKGGYLNFGGSYTGTTVTNWAGIAGRKENGTDGNTAGYLALSTRPNGSADTERMRITSTGNVGIGTVAPNHKMQIAAVANYGDLTTGYTLALANTPGTGVGSNPMNIGVLQFGDSTVANNSAGRIAVVQSNPAASTATYMQFFSNAGGGNVGLTERMRIDSTGNVGIGTTGPLSKLDVNGGMAVGSYAGVSAAPANGMIISGNVGIGTTSPYAKLSLESSYSAINTNDFAVFARTGGAISATIGYDATAQTGDAMYFGTGTNHPLQLRVNNSEKLRITTAGNVGIGTTTPTAALDILSPSGALKVMQVQSNSAVSGGYTVYRDSANNSSRGVIGHGNSTWTNGLISDFGMFSYGDLLLGSNAVEKMRITSAGNVGIGTTSPAQKLDVAGTVAIGTFGTNSYLKANYNNDLIAGVDTSGYYYGTGFGVSSALPMFIGENNSLLHFRAGGSERITVNGTTGNVGIGTTSPTAKLHVAGGIIQASDVTNDATIYMSPISGSYGMIQAANNANSVAKNLVLQQFGGSVGIGTTGPNNRLEVVGVNSQTARLTAPTAGAGTSLIFADGGTPTKYNWITGSNYNVVNAFEITPSTAIGGTTFSTPAVTVLQSGNVGIGTTGPLSKLDVNGGMAVGSYAGVSAAPSNGMIISGNVGIGTTGPLGPLSVSHSGTNYSAIVVGDHTTPGNGTGIYFRTNGGVALLTTATGGQFQIGTTAGGTIGNGIRIDTNGNVGIGTTSPVSKLSVVGESALAGGLSVGLGYAGTAAPVNGAIIQGNVGIGTTSPATKLEVGGNTANVTFDGYLNCAGFTSDANGKLVCTASDQRLKQYITPLASSTALAGIDALTPVSFYWRDADRGPQEQFGLIAQQVATVFPNLVQMTNPTPLTPDGTLTVNYSGFISPMILAIQELNAKMRQLEPLTGVLSVVPGVESQCVVGDTRLRRRRRGGASADEYDEIEIKDIVAGDEIQSLDERTGTVVYSRVNALIDMGEQEVYELVTKSGRKIRTTSNHPFLVRAGASES